MNTEYKILLFSDYPDDVVVFEKTISDTMTKDLMVSYDFKNYVEYSEVAESIFNKNRYDIYFFDYEKEASLSLAKMFVNLGIHEPIVFVTSNPINRSSAYSINLLDYLFRPIDPSVLKKLILYDFKTNFLTDKILLKKNSNAFYIDPSNIVFIEVYGYGIKIYMSNQWELTVLSRQPDLSNDINIDEKSLFYSTRISEFKKKLNPALFIQCHQSFIINLSKVISIRRYSAILDNHTNNGTIVYISKSKYDAVRNSFLQFDANNTKQLLDSELALIAGGQAYEYYKKK